MNKSVLYLALSPLAFALGYLAKPTETPTYETTTNASDTSVAKTSTSSRYSNLSKSVNRIAEDFPEEFKNHLDINNVLTGMIRNILNTNDVGRAAKLLENYTDENAKTGMRELVVAVWSEKEPEKALQWLESIKNTIPENEFPSFYAYTLNQLAMSKPELASEKFNNLEHGSPAREAIILGLTTNGGWGMSDPKAGFAWLETIQNEPDIAPETINQAYSNLMLGYMNIDRDAAAEAIAQLDSSSLRANLVKPLVLKYAETGFDDAVDFINSINDPVAKRFAAAQFLEVHGPNDPERTIAYAINELDGNSGKQTFLRQSFLTLAALDLDKATDHYYELDEINQPAAMEAIAYRAIELHGPEATENWISQLDNSQAKDTAYGALAINAGNNAPEAIKAAMQIRDADKKTEVLSNVATTMNTSQLFELRKAMNTANLGSYDSASVSKIINERINDAYGELLVPGT